MWTIEQSKRLEELLEGQQKDPDNIWVGYWNSDQHGRPTNGGSDITAAAPGVIHELTGELKICANGLHATRELHQWRGYRVWVVALIGKRVDEEIKSAGIRREIIGEVLPEECLDARIGVRIGRKDLGGANLEFANMYGSDLMHADLRGANLYKATLCHAHLYKANLAGANLKYANLTSASMEFANLAGANLRGADMKHSNIYAANLEGADLTSTNLSGCYFGRWNDRPKWLDERYRIDNGYIL